MIQFGVYWSDVTVDHVLEIDPKTYSIVQRHSLKLPFNSNIDCALSLGRESKIFETGPSLETGPCLARSADLKIFGLWILL